MAGGKAPTGGGEAGPPGLVGRAGASGHRTARRRLRPPALLLPLGAALVVAVLAATGVHGSSVGIYATDAGVPEGEAGVLAGPPRPIRSDEWLVRTPWVLRQLERGLPDRAPGGVGTHDVAVLMDVPTRGWEVVLRPHTLGYHLLGAERAFALEWWLLHAVQLLGVYTLLLTLTGRVALSALGASLVTLSPVTQWWSVPFTFTIVGYGCLATALVVTGHRARTARGRVALSALAGLALAAFLAALYPPWQIGVALVLVPVGLAAVLPTLRAPAGRRRALASLAVVVGVAVGLGGALFGAFLVDHDEAVEAISSTVYPGRRTAHEGGGVPLPSALGSAFDSFAAGRPYLLANGTNQSENASALPLLLPAGAGALLLLAGRRLRGSPSAPVLVACVLGGSVLALWMLAPVPAAAGRLLLLTRVQPSRMLLPAGLAGVLALAVLAAHQQESGDRLARWQVAASAGVFGAALAWAARGYTVDHRHIDLVPAAALGLVAVAGVALALGRRPVAGLAVLALFGGWQSSLVNPVQRGLDPLTRSPLRAAVDSVLSEAPAGAGWVAFEADATVRGTLTAAGVDNLAGVSPYPDRPAWRVLDPALAHQEDWNRYAHVSFATGAPGSAPAFTLRAPDDLVVTLDPCSPALRRLGVRYAVTQGAGIGPCARPVARVRHGRSDVVVYRYGDGA